MDKKTPYAPDNQTKLPLEHYMQAFANLSPQNISLRTGCALEGNTIVLNVLNERREITWPKFENEGWKDYDRILFLHYLIEGYAVSPSERFLSYAEMPWGEVYDRNFRGRCTRRLAAMLGGNEELYHKVCLRLGGTRIQGSGLVYDFEFMHNLHVRTIIWPGDDEFPSSAQILFSDNFPHAFQAEDRVVVAEYIIGKMKKTMQAIAAENK